MAAIALPRRLRAVRFEGSWPWLALAIGIALRIAILVFAVDTWVHADDPRYEGKNLARREWPKYPVWWDALYLSVFAVDMAGNFTGQYLTNIHFDHIPHFHGPGALAVVFAAAFGFGPVAAAGLSTILHTALEVNEFYGDVYAGTKNVRDLFDSMNDLTAGLLGVGVYLVLYYQLRNVVELRRAARPRRRRH